MSDGIKLVTIDHFIMEMLGYKSRITYYNHLDDEGWPQRVYPGGKPMLVLAECEAYMAKLLSDRSPPKGPFVKSKAGQGVRANQPKRHTGRPAKVLPPRAEGAAKGADNGST